MLVHDDDASDSRCFFRYMCPVCGTPECHDEECRKIPEGSVRDMRAERPVAARARWRCRFRAGAHR